MYSTLAHLPQVLLNQSYESYVTENLFKPLGMGSSTLKVAEAESRGQLADGFSPDMQDLTRGINGTLRPIIPFSPRPGEEVILAGAGGVFSSARDLVSGGALCALQLLTMDLSDHVDCNALEWGSTSIHQCDGRA